MTASSPERASDPLKYEPGVGPRFNEPGARPLELATLIHVAVFAVAASWWFGGQSPWSRTILAAWGSLSGVILLASFGDRYAWKERNMRPLWWLLPLAAFDVLVVIGALNPSFRSATLDGASLLIAQPRPIYLPTSVQTKTALEALWVFNAIWLSCFNVALIVRKRKTLRTLLTLLVLSAGLLAIFGTVQKLSGSTGLFFDAVPSPQPKFFASFIYHNHWGAFALLMLAACLGLIWHEARRKGARDFLHSPAFSGIVLVLLLALTLPLSLSRSTTLAGIVLLVGALVHLVVQVISARRRHRESIVPPVLGMSAALAVASAGIWSIAGESILARFDKSREQLAEMRAVGSIGGRATLYRDTVRMGQARPIFGWGMASYPHVFTLYNTMDSPVDRLPVFYNDAHSDWLQSFAEHGVAGTALLGLCALVPLFGLRWRHVRNAVPSYLLSGCALVALYAWIEFPFGNFAVVLYWWLLFFSGVHYCRLIGREEKKASGEVRG